MKNFTRYVFAFAVAGAVMASCDVNKPDIFDDANAFVAFDNETMSIDEVMDGTATLTVPVTLASVAGIEESVSFRLVDGTAEEGVNYELLTTSGVLNFNAENRTQNIEISILYDGEYTGNLTFTIEFVNTGSVNQGAENTCTVTIVDSDHPLAPLFGTYTFSGNNYWNGPVTWTATISSDPDDDHRVWILNLPQLSNGFETVVEFYGTVDADMTTITIPFGQSCPSYYYQEEDDVLLLGIDSEDNAIETGSIVATISKDASGNVTGLDFGSQYGLWCYVSSLGANLNIVSPGITATKN